MSIIRNFADAYSTEELTDAIVNIPNVSGMIKSLGLFSPNYTDQLSVSLDKKDEYVSLLHDVNRNGGSPTREGDSEASIHSFRLAYFQHMDMVTESDFRGKRKIGTANEKETLDSIVAEKLVRMKAKVDLTQEFMQLKALNGICSTPNGTVLADMFTDFGVTRPVVDFDFANTADVGDKILESIDTTQAGLQSGGMFSGDLLCFVNPTFFNKLKSHASVTQAYYNSTSNERYQKSMSEFRQWGAVATFSHQGITFVSYNYKFPTKNADGTTTYTQAIPDDDGFIVPRMAGENLFEAWYGPSRKIGSQGGNEMFVDVFEDPRGYFMELSVETSPLYLPRKPGTLTRVTTSS